MGPLFVAVCELILVASLAVDHGLQVHGLQSQAQWSWCMGFSCSLACGIFSDQGSYPWPLHWQADSYLLYHQRIWVWDLASPFLQLIFKWDEYFCLFKRDGWGRTAFLTSTLGFSVWLFSESELPGIFFFFSSPWIVSGPSLASPLLFLSYLLRTLLSATSPQHRALPGTVCLVCYHQQFTGTSLWMDPASAKFLQPCWNLPHLEACKAPSHFCRGSRNSLPCFSGSQW